ncbi:UNVERIFIED_CONTAM: hypothetical protein FKN15_058931 [Acipenser sinensis]
MEVSGPSVPPDSVQVKKAADGAKTTPDSLPKTTEGEKGEAIADDAGPSGPPESVQGLGGGGTKPPRKKKRAAKISGGVKQGGTKPTTTPSSGGLEGVPVKETPSLEPPVRKDGKSTRKTKHLTPQELQPSTTGGSTAPLVPPPPPPGSSCPRSAKE